MIRSGLAPNASIPRNFRAAAQASSPNYGMDEAQVTLRKGIRLTFIGLALTIGLSFVGLHSESADIPVPGLMPVTTWHPGPWLLGGLVPMFVGLAQVVTALLSGATLRPVTNGNGAYVPPPPNVPPPFDSVTYEGPYTYRPDDTQELRPPRTPPERRS